MMLHFCQNCNEYSLGAQCKKGHDAKNRSLNFRQTDKHFELRIEEIKSEFGNKKCLTSKNLKKLTLKTQY